MKVEVLWWWAVAVGGCRWAVGQSAPSAEQHHRRPPPASPIPLLPAPRDARLVFLDIPLSTGPASTLNPFSPPPSAQGHLARADQSPLIAPSTWLYSIGIAKHPGMSVDTSCDEVVARRFAGSGFNLCALRKISPWKWGSIKALAEMDFRLLDVASKTRSDIAPTAIVSSSLSFILQLNRLWKISSPSIPRGVQRDLFSLRSP